MSRKGLHAAPGQGLVQRPREGPCAHVSAGAGPTAPVAARLTAARASQLLWPASAAARPSPGGATITTAPVRVWGSQEEGSPDSEGDQDGNVLSASQFKGGGVGPRGWGAGTRQGGRPHVLDKLSVPLL